MCFGRQSGLQDYALSPATQAVEVFSTEETVAAAANRITGPNQTCAFDELNRITSRVQNGVTRSYEHDSVGNRTSESWSAAPQAGTRSYTYDWDEFNRLRGIAGDRRGGSGNNAWITNAWSESYLYRADGLRLQKVYANSLVDPENASSIYDYNQVRNDTTWRYAYDGQMVAWEDYSAYDANVGGIAIVDLTRYGLGARGIDLISAKRTTSEIANDELMTNVTTDPVLGSTNERVSFPLYDGHGNTIATLARNGTGYSIANQKRFDVWGKVRSDSSVGSSGQILNPTQKYCGNLGHKYDATSGLTYMRARYYEAETGRFISEDPAGEGPNWFTYCLNNPTTFADETGKSAQVVVYALLNAAGFAIGFLLGGGLTSWLLAQLNPAYKPPAGIMQMCVDASLAIAGGVATALVGDTKALKYGTLSVTEFCKRMVASVSRIPGAKMVLSFSGAAKVGLIVGVYSALLSYFMSDAYSDSVGECMNAGD